MCVGYETLGGCLGSYYPWAVRAASLPAAPVDYRGLILPRHQWAAWKVRLPVIRYWLTTKLYLQTGAGSGVRKSGRGE